MRGVRSLAIQIVIGVLTFSALPVVQAPALDRAAPFIATPYATVKRMLEIAGVKTGELVADLGSGDGRIPIAAAKDFGARGLGIELNPHLVERSRANAERAGVSDRVTFLQQDLFKTDLREIDVLTMYLLQEVTVTLQPQILAQMRPGARVVSHAFPMGGWEPDAVYRSGRIYLWVVPAHAAGRWSVHDPAETFTLRLDQTFQKIAGTADFGGRSEPIRHAVLKGAEFSFEVAVGGQTRRYRGTIEADTIQGTSETGPWRATRLERAAVTVQNPNIVPAGRTTMPPNHGPAPIILP
ncbi:MAG: methyltransferase domain-containing protein [Alphaproteobacteria bacterium]|nr:methyltransferase domain-containing protein [Alphaproteobacteria bacterium]